MKNLQELCKEYSKNIIDKKTYRDARSKLIQAICSNEIEVIDKPYLPPLDILATPIPVPIPIVPTSDEDLPKNNITENSEVEEIPAHNSKNYIRLFYIAIFLCIIIITISLKFIPESNQKEQSSIATLAIPPWKVLITQFLQQKNWQTLHMNEFIESWENNLTEEEMLIASKSPEMKRLANAIYQRLLDKRALLSLDKDANIVTDQQNLVDFADKLRINDERMIIIENSDYL